MHTNSDMGLHQFMCQATLNPEAVEWSSPSQCSVSLVPVTVPVRRKEQKLQTYFIIYKCVCFCTQLCNVESTGCILVKLCASELCYVKYDII